MEQLNVEMYGRAKAFIQVAKQKPRHFLIKSEPWSLWYQGKKIIKNIMASIYEIVYIQLRQGPIGHKRKSDVPIARQYSLGCH
jgi:hypothetical protein